MGLGVFGTAIATALAEPLALFYVVGPHLKKSSVINIYVGKFDNTVIFPVISNGIGPLVSYNYGAKNFKRVWESMKFSYVVSFIIGAIIFIIIMIFGERLIGLFISDNVEIINLALTGARIFAVGYLINGFNILNSAYFTSIGLAKESVIIALSRGCVVILIAIFILPNIFGENGLWMSVPFAEIVTVGVSLFLLKRYKSESN
ncbi:MAG: MATE family efflux transporter [Clostridium sp.]